MRSGGKVTALFSPGNTLVIWKLDRLGRDSRHLVSVVEEPTERESACGP